MGFHEIRQAPVLGFLLVKHDPHQEGGGGQVRHDHNQKAWHQKQRDLGCPVVGALEAPQQESCRHKVQSVRDCVCVCMWRLADCGCLPLAMQVLFWLLTCKATMARRSGGVSYAASHLEQSLQAPTPWVSINGCPAVAQVQAQHPPKQ